MILRAYNHGDGGILVLASPPTDASVARPARRAGLLLLGVAGAALFYGDSLIMPGISVLGSVEGLEIVATALKSYVVPMSMAVLVGLFVMQRR